MKMHAYKPRYIAATVTATFMYFMTIVPLLAEAGTNAGSREKVSTSASTEVSVPGVLSEEAAGAIKSASATRNAPFKALNVIRAILPTVTATSDMAHIEQKLHQEATDPPIIGTGLDIPELNWVGAVKSNFFHLDATAGGSLFGMRILSVGAVGIRLGLLIEHIPAEARFAFFTADSDEAVAPPVNGDEIVKLLALNLAAGDSSNEGRTYWSPVVKGEEVVILVYVPKDIDPNELRFTIPRISHIFKEPLSDKAAGACNLDTTCYSSWSDEAKAVAKMVFTESGDSFLCTGSLLADQDQSSMIPYFLSANHCISTQTVASSLETYWFWQSASCNDSARDSRYSMLTEGAQLLYANSTSDTSFMRLNSQPPVGVSYLGWTTEDPSIGANVTGIHHPHGDRKKISFGDFEGFYPYLGSTPVTNGNHIGIYWTLGTSEGGSSGSPLLNNSGQVIGQLHGGGASCSTPNEMDYYGRFDLAYDAKLKLWLGGGNSQQPDFVVTSIILNPAAPTANSTFSATVSVKT
ncbi:MAG: trypsin-like peptidase domain-containing protein [Pedobacter sp.]